MKFRFLGTKIVKISFASKYYGKKFRMAQATV